jgi:YihY family inner membrane protein
MSTAARVPETFELTGDDAKETLAHIGRGRLLRDAFQRMRAADGFSHARSTAYLGSLVLVQCTIALVGIASVVGEHGVGRVIVATFRDMFPGPAGRVLSTSVQQAQVAAISGRNAGIAFGLVGGLIAATTLFGQMERSLNRLYGIEQDRPTVRKYGRALVLALTVGLLSAAAFVALAFGRPLGDELGDAQPVWMVLRWPLGLGAAAAAMALLFKVCPRRRQPAWSWLAFGAAVSVTLWALVTVALGAFFSFSSSFGKTYGPLAGIVALLLWALLSAIAILYGGAVAAQLEAVRSNRPGPKDPRKNEDAPRAHELVGTR